MRNILCKSILVVEDDTAIREGIVEILELAGYNAYSASNGKDAYELLHKVETPCLILLDLMMPTMDGWEFSNLKQGDVMLAPIPMVIVSAYDQKDPVKGNVKGACGHLKKPINVKTLLHVVKDYCGEGICVASKQIS